MPRGSGPSLVKVAWDAEETGSIKINYTISKYMDNSRLLGLLPKEGANRLGLTDLGLSQNGYGLRLAL